MGFDLVPTGYHSAVPPIDGIPDDAFERRSAMHGIHWDVDEQLRFIEEHLAPYLAEPVWPHEEAAGYHYVNRYFEEGDADVGYAMVRALRPSRIVELGSGWSSLVLGEAAARNASDGAPPVYRIFDPYPAALGRPLPHAAQVEKVPAQDIDEAVFTELRDGDVLFIDTSHVARVGSDVTRVLLEILPLLAPGVVVHVHDVRLPFDLPRVWLEAGWYWTEQYLLQALLCGNPGFRVLVGLHSLTRERPERFRALVPSWDGRGQPSSIWIRREA